MDAIVHQSNLYSVQSNHKRPLNLTTLEFEWFLETFFLMCIIKILCSRLYWSGLFPFNAVSDVVTRDRWEEIKRNKHFNENSTMPLPGDENYDKLYKVRPLITYLQTKFRNIPMPQMMCIDEQLVPFKGSSTLKHYLSIKPHKWGYKIYSLCDTNGLCIILRCIVR